MQDTFEPWPTKRSRGRVHVASATRYFSYPSNFSVKHPVSRVSVALSSEFCSFRGDRLQIVLETLVTTFSVKHMGPITDVSWIAGSRAGLRGQALLVEAAKLTQMVRAPNR